MTVFDSFLTKKILRPHVTNTIETTLKWILGYPNDWIIEIPNQPVMVLVCSKLSEFILDYFRRRKWRSRLTIVGIYLWYRR